MHPHDDKDCTKNYRLIIIIVFHVTITGTFIIVITFPLQIFFKRNQDGFQLNGIVIIDLHNTKLTYWTLVPKLDRKLLMRRHFGVVFQAKSNGEVKSAVQLYKSADKCADFSICVQNWAYEGSFWGSFSSQIQW